MDLEGSRNGELNGEKLYREPKIYEVKNFQQQTLFEPKLWNIHSPTRLTEILKNYFADDFEQIFKNSELLQYINIKTKSANRVQNQEGVLEIFMQSMFL